MFHLSGKTNWRNSRLSLLQKKSKYDDKGYRLLHGTGVNRIFTRYKKHKGGHGAPLGKFQLESENHPNGNRLLYSYYENELYSVNAKNKFGEELAQLSIIRNTHLRKVTWNSI